MSANFCKKKTSEAFKRSFALGWEAYEKGLLEKNFPTGQQLANKLIGKHKAGVQNGLKRAFTTGYWLARVSK